MTVDEMVKVLDERWSTKWVLVQMGDKAGGSTWCVDIVTMARVSKSIAYSKSLESCLRQAVENEEGREVE